MTVVLSVKQKILLSLWLMTFLMLVLAGVLASVWFTQDQAKRLDDFLVTESRSVQELLQTYFNTNGGEGADVDSVSSADFLAFVDAYFKVRLDRPQPYKTTLGIFSTSGVEVKASNTALNLSSVKVPMMARLQMVTVDEFPSYRMAVVSVMHNRRALGTIRLACLTVTLEDAGRSYVVSLVAVLGLIFVSFGLLGSASIHWSLRPIRQMSLSAQDISDSHLDLRLVVPPGKDKIAQMAETLNKLLAKLESDFEFEEALLGHLSHELRTPLTILRARNEIALDKNSDKPSVRSVFEDNLAEIDSIVSLLTTLLNLARMEGKMGLVHRQPCDLAVVLQDLIEEFEPLWEEKELSFQLSLPGGNTSWATCPPVESSGDPSLLRQGFLNILTNAFKYTPRGGRIHLSIDEAGTGDSPQWRLTFQNPGPPIPEESLDLVFKRFYRVEVQDPDHYERTSGLEQRGFGLGLSITKTVVELHNGRIRAYNPGDGAAFEILLPRTPTTPLRGSHRSVRSRTALRQGR